MNTFATKEKLPVPAARKACPYVHNPIGPVQQAQQAAMRKILRPDEVQAKSDIGEPDDKYEQETDHAVTDLHIPAISGIPRGVPGDAPPIQRSENEEPEEELQRQPEEEEEEPIQAKLIQRQMTDMRGIRPLRFGYLGPKQKAQQAEIRRILRSNGAQAKLTIGQPNDKYEQEADRVADQVMAMPDPKLQRQPENEEDEEEPIQAKRLSNQLPLLSADVQTQIQFLKGDGQSLPKPEREYFEPRFGVDFENVRVHSDNRAALLAQSINAQAFTHGQNLVFGAGHYSPGSRTGRKLLAHELTHVVQQGRHFSMPHAEPAMQRQVLDKGKNMASTCIGPHAISAASEGRLQRNVNISPTDPEVTLFLNTLTRLTGRPASAANGTLALGTPTPGTTRISATVTDYVQRAIAASRAYTLRSGTTTTGGTTVRGVRWEAATSGGGISITVNAVDIGRFKWKAEELVSEGFVNAVAANDRTTQTYPATSAGTNLDDLLANTLPFANSALLRTAMTLIKQRVLEVANDVRLEIEVETALRGASGITLSEVLRGLETNTAYRIVQSISGNRVRATYLDPRSRPGAGEHQTLPRRGVTFLAGPGRATPRAAPVRGAACCSRAATAEIKRHLVTSRRLITNTIAHLCSRANLNRALTAHFGRAGVANRARIAGNYRLILSEMEFSRHGWICTRRGSGQGCNNPRVTGRTGIALPDVQLCIERSAPFVPRSSTVLHEVVHASGIGTLSAGTELYAGQPSYPGRDPLHNADSYAQFAATVGASAPAPAPVTSTTPTTRPSTAPAPAALQRVPLDSSTAELHQEIAETYRHSHHLPAGGVDEFGNSIGPSDAEIIYGALWLPVTTLSELASMKPWELVRTPRDRLVAPAGSTQPATGPNYADYNRAQTVVRKIHNFINLTYDYERNGAPVGMEPNAAQLRILNRNLSQVLSTFNVRALVTGQGGRGLPTAPGGTTATLAGRARLLNSIGDFAGKRYQLERSAGADRFMNTQGSQLESDVRRAWTDPNVGVTAATGARVTTQEKVAVVVLGIAIGASLEPAFYFPAEDKIYLSRHVNLTTLEGADIARHETVHLLGGRETTRQAFIRQYGTNWKRYWKPFEEGVVEFINISSRTAAQTPPSARGPSGFRSGYTQHYRQIQSLIASSGMGRNTVLRAFFTGRIPAAMFGRWQQIVGTP